MRLALRRCAGVAVGEADVGCCCRGRGWRLCHSGLLAVVERSGAVVGTGQVGAVVGIEFAVVGVVVDTCTD